MSTLPSVYLMARVFVSCLFLFGLVWGLEFQEPIPGTYHCYVSSESFFDPNAQDAGANLSIGADGSYQLVAGANSETGQLSTFHMDDSSDLTELFQSGSLLSLQPSSNVSPYQGMFIIDSSGSLYVILQNNNASWIRCQSEGANLYEAMQTRLEAKAKRDASLKGAEERGRIPVLSAMQDTAQGTYACYYSRDDYDDNGNPAPEPFEKSFDLQFFSNHQYLCTASWNADGCNDRSEKNQFELAPDGRFIWLGGDMEIYYDDWVSRYGQSSNGIPTFVMYEEDEDVWTGKPLYDVIKCARIGEVTDASPSEQETAEYQLLPADIKAPAPPPGAGGLSGLYADFTVRQNTYSVLGNNGMPYLQVDILPPEFMYFLPSGYVYKGIYEWSYDELDCQRVKKDGRPLCDTYVISPEGITFGSEGRVLPLQIADKDLSLDGTLWAYQEGASGLTLDGVWEYTSGFGGMAISSSFWTFGKDGSFMINRSSAISYTTPGVAGSTASVAGYNQDPTSTGKYKIVGNTIELSFADGHTEKRVFNFSKNDNGVVDSVYLNGQLYWPSH
ncbi:MAG: hypothetical protein KC422_22875 [Trueperaceae bacterium]|nr:hypothetical protein [Trueperaceae bacterium]